MRAMIFVGDVALPKSESLKFSGIPEKLLSDKWIINLEGAIVESAFDKGVYNNLEGFMDYNQQIPVTVACLANNHITDTEPVSTTRKILNEKGIACLGAGTIDNCIVPVVVNDFVILNFAWPVIQAIPATKNREGVNELSIKNVKKQFFEVKKNYPEQKIIIVFHWNFELELYPMPRQREFGKYLIDNGAHLIIGHHSHLFQGVETYKGKFIAHGLGNWAFEQKAYYNGTLKFPETSLRQCALQYVEESNSVRLHFFRYSIEERIVKFVETVSIKDTDSYEASYIGLSPRDYLKYFKKNRLKRKLLPIYKWSDSKTTVLLKDYFMLLRDKSLKLIRNI